VYHEPAACYDAGVRGALITFEGLDGTGKSTQMGKLAEALRAAGCDVVTTREPGGTPIGEDIRAVLLNSRTRDLAPEAEMALMFAARAQHIQELILPAMSAGQIVLCDRFTDSTEAYQGGGRQFGSDAVLALHEVLCEGLQPDLTILMEGDLQACLARARRRNQESARSKFDENRFERENKLFFQRVHDAFLAIAEREPQRVKVVDARRPIPAVHAEIVKIVREFLKRRKLQPIQRQAARA
jgi:dTMP kinase